MNKKLFPLILFVVGLSACYTPNAANAPATNSPVGTAIAGIYRGTLPCADCAGIETTLALRPNGSFTLDMNYLKDKAFPVPTQTGTWKATGAIVELFPAETTPASANDRWCFGIANPSTLIQFDISCAPIDGRESKLVKDK
jgi:uncharacterized lipoprotein NlpE involved in copper resistance